VDPPRSNGGACIASLSLSLSLFRSVSPSHDEHGRRLQARVCVVHVRMQGSTGDVRFDVFAQVTRRTGMYVNGRWW